MRLGIFAILVSLGAAACSHSARGRVSDAGTSTQTSVTTSTATGTQIAIGRPYIQVSAAGYHACGLRADGSATCWGDNSYGKAIPPAGTFVQIAAGEWFSCGLRANGFANCWGSLVTPDP